MGGGAFILIAMANGTSEVVDAREQAPVSATEEMFVGDPNASLTGGTAVAVPGELQGLRMAWERHGAAPWSDNVLPVAALAESFVVDAEVADAIASSADALRRFEASARLFLPGDRPPAAGATLTNTARSPPRCAPSPRGPTRSRAASSPRSLPPRSPQPAAPSQPTTLRSTPPCSASRCGSTSVARRCWACHRPPPAVRRCSWRCSTSACYRRRCRRRARPSRHTFSSRRSSRPSRCA